MNAGRVSGQGGQHLLNRIRREAPKKFFNEFAHSGFQVAHPPYVTVAHPDHRSTLVPT